jgi:glutathione S-transferase
MEAATRARATQWLIAALKLDRAVDPERHGPIELFYADQVWAKLRRPGVIDFARHRLSSLAKALGEKPCLEGERFSAGDPMMTTVLRIRLELLSTRA